MTLLDPVGQTWLDGTDPDVGQRLQMSTRGRRVSPDDPKYGSQ